MAAAMKAPPTEAVNKLKRQKKSNGRLWCFFGVCSLVELWILLMISPSYLGNETLEKILTAMGDFFVSLLWPASPRETGTYRETIYNVCTWVTDLWFYPLLRFIGQWFPITGLAVTTVRHFKLSSYIKNGGRPQKVRKKWKWPWKWPRKWTFNGFNCKPDPLKCAQANDYLKAQQEMNNSFFPLVSGVWVRRFTGIDERSESRPRDYVVPWRPDHTIILENIGPAQIVKIFRENGKVYLETDGENYPMHLRCPIIIQHENAHGKVTQDAVITWIGG